MAFRGRSGTELDAIEVCCFEIHLHLVLMLVQPIWSDTRNVAPLSVKVGSQQGGRGGQYFDMLNSVGNPLTTSLKSIVMRVGNEIDAIEVGSNA